MQYALEWYHKTGIYKEDRNMTKNEAVALIRQKMKDAKLNYEWSLDTKRYNDSSWYNGIYRGLQDALQVIGMLDNEHNRLKSSL